MQAHTLYSSVRPFGSSVIFAMRDDKGEYFLYMIEPSGSSFGYNACVAGTGKQSAKAALEKLDFSSLDVRDAVRKAAKMFDLT